MKWFGRRRRTGDQDVDREVAELLDPYNDRPSVDEPSGGRVTFTPGKVIDNLRDRMERVTLDPLVEISGSTSSARTTRRSCSTPEWVPRSSRPPPSTEPSSPAAITSRRGDPPHPRQG